MTSAGATSRSFFFQAEDGIRDKLVTRVQTCALPIWGLAMTERLLGRRGKVLAPYLSGLADLPGQDSYPPLPELSGQAALERLTSALTETLATRSEERRVGKECRPRAWRRGLGVRRVA